MCLPLFGLPSTLHCDRTTMHNHTRFPPSLPFTRMQQHYNAPHTSSTGLPLHQYITIPHLVATKPITLHSLNTFDLTYLTISGYRSTPLLIHSTHYLSLYYSFPLSPALDSVNMYSPPSSLSMTRSANTCLQDGRSHPRVHPSATYSLRISPL